MSSIQQQALDVCSAVTSRIQNGGDPSSKENMLDLVTAVQLLAQNALGSTPSVDAPDAGATNVDVAATIPAVDPQS